MDSHDTAEPHEMDSDDTSAGAWKQASVLGYVSLALSLTALGLSAIALTRTAIEPVPSVNVEAGPPAAVEPPPTAGANMPGVGPSDPQAGRALAEADGVVVGRDDAPVTVYEFADLQCPACRTAALQFLPVFKQRYVDTGQVRFVSLDFPLERIHPNAFEAALAGRCADEQGVGWAFQMLAYERQSEWGRSADATEHFLRYGEEAGAENGSFAACIEEEQYADVVRDNQALGRQLGVTGTPTFFVEGRTINGGGQSIVFAVEAELDG